MDIATLLGLAGAFGLIIWSMLQGGTLAAYTNIPGLAIVLGGSIMVVLLRSSLQEFTNAVKVAGKAFGKALEKPDELISQLVEFASIARKDGMIALEGQEIENPFMEKAIGMLVDGAEEDMITKTLTQDIESMKLRHKQGAAIFSSWGEVAPAMGMIGTKCWGICRTLNLLARPWRLHSLLQCIELLSRTASVFLFHKSLPFALRLNLPTAN